MNIGEVMYIYTYAVNEYTQFDFDHHGQQYQSSRKYDTEVCSFWGNVKICMFQLILILA